MRAIRAESGVALVVALFMVGLLTIIGVTAIKLSTTHFRLVGNLQQANEIEMATRAAIERYVSEHPCPLCSTTVVAVPVQQRTLDVSVCASYVGPSKSDAEDSNSLPNSDWDISAKSSSAVSGESVTVHWGISLAAANNCPARCQCPSS